MKKCLYIIFLFMLSAACKKEAEEFNPKSCTGFVAMDNDHLQSADIQRLLDNYVRKGIPGISTVISSGTQGFFYGSSGYASLSNMTLLQACNTFRVASLTKTFMATAIMQLAEEGEIDLDAQISSILDNNILDGLDKAYETTVEELLSHTSGIPNYDDNSRFVASVLNEPGKRLTVEDRLDFARDLEGTPDWVIEKYELIYSNTNYVLLQLILEKVTGNNYDQYILQRIIEPLDLSHTTFSTIKTFPDGLSAGYCDMFDNRKLRDVNLFDANRWSGEAAMISNGLDIYTFYNSLLKAELTSAQTLESMISNNLGLLHETIDGIEGIGHDGQGIGYSSEMWFFPKKDLIIVLIANQGRISSDQPSIQQFENALVDILKLHD